MTENEIATRAIERARAGKTLPLRAIFAALGSGPSRLARAPDVSGHQSFINKAIESEDPIDLGVLGDYHEENGLPGANLLRMAHEQGRGHTDKGFTDGFHTIVHPEGPMFPSFFGEDGKKSSKWYPHTTEVYPQHYANGIGFRMAITGDTEDKQLKFNVLLTHPDEVRRALSDLPRPLATTLARYVAQQWRGRKFDRSPTRLARGDGDSITWVGGTIPNATRAIGVWSGGREASSVLTLPSKDADTAAPEIARSAGQKSALWFTPGEGNDILHVLSVSAHPKEVAAGLNKHGVNEFTMIPKNGKTLVHVVDAGGVRAASVRAYATESGAKYASRPGTSRFVNFTGSGPTPLARKRDTDPRARAQELNAWLHAAETDGSDATLGAFADWLREVSGNPDDPRAWVVQHHRPIHVFQPFNDPTNPYLFSISDRAPFLYNARRMRRANGLSFHALSETPTGKPSHALVHWTVPQKRAGNNRYFGVRLTPNELHDFIDRLPSEHDRHIWREHASLNDLRDTRGV